jgi:hypothetical protein
VTRLLERLPFVTITMSVPLFFSMHLKRPPESLHGLPFLAVWTWGVVAVVALPVLIVIEAVMSLKR